VAQRRKRVFIVSDFGGESVDEILAITESLPRYPAPSREAGKGTAGDATKGVGEGGHKLELPEVCATITGELAKHTNNQMVQNAESFFIPKAQGADVYNGELTGETTCTVTTNTGVGSGSGPKVIEQKETYCLQGGGETSQSSQGSGVNKDVAFTLNGLDKHGVAYEDKKSMSFAPSDLKRGFGQKPEIELSGTLKKEHNDQSPHVATYEWHNQDSRIREQQQASTLSCNAGGKEGNLVRENLTVRRLTPIECERLQGFPNNWTSEKMELILEGNEWKATDKVVKQADGPRYKAMGNAVTVNVAEWIGKQIGKVLS